MMDFMTGQFILTALSFAPTGTLACNGQSASIASYTDLYEILGTAYGGNGTTNFNLPNLPPVQAATGTLNWVLVTEGAPYPSGMEALLGEVRLLPIAPPQGSALAQSFVPAEGQPLSISDNQALFALMGTQYGGNGTTTFAMPKLDPVRATNGPAIPYWVCMAGTFPPIGGNSVVPIANDYLFPTYLGSVLQLAYAPNYAQQIKSLGLCLGQTMQINEWQAVFSLLGTTYGGNGTMNFLLPNLPVGPGVLTQNALVINGIYPPRS